MLTIIVPLMMVNLAVASYYMWLRFKYYLGDVKQGLFPSLIFMAVQSLDYATFCVSIWFFASRYWITSVRIKNLVAGKSESHFQTKCIGSTYYSLVILNALVPCFLLMTPFVDPDKTKVTSIF
jgi:hypothetical protein